MKPTSVRSAPALDFVGLGCSNRRARDRCSRARVRSTGYSPPVRSSDVTRSNSSAQRVLFNARNSHWPAPNRSNFRLRPGPTPGAPLSSGMCGCQQCAILLECRAQPTAKIKVASHVYVAWHSLMALLAIKLGRWRARRRPLPARYRCSRAGACVWQESSPGLFYILTTLRSFRAAC
jgi:hypothetical protein